MEELKFLNEGQVRQLVDSNDTPFYVYSKSQVVSAINEVKVAFDNIQYGLTIRYAMKANPHVEILQIMESQNVQIDASSEYEAEKALASGFDPAKVLLTSQQLPKEIKRALSTGIEFTATSLHQLNEYAKVFPNTNVSVRLNTGLGSGFNHRNTTGGIEVGFGIWFHKADNHGDQIRSIADKHNLTIKRVHIHIGTGSDPEIWGQLMDVGLFAIEQFPKATTLNLGGGFKLGYIQGEKGADLPTIGETARRKLEEFYKKTGRKIKLEIEPGRYLVARAGAIVSTIIDETDTGEDGDHFLKLDTGMTEIIRTSMYGSQHPLVVVGKEQGASEQSENYVVVGHCCESSDILTTESGNPEQIAPRKLAKASIGDYMIIEMAGAYCASMSASGYNSFPLAGEILID